MSQVNSITLCLDTKNHIGLEEHEQTDILAKQGLNTKKPENCKYC